jgi:TonB family protein
MRLRIFAFLLLTVGSSTFAQGHKHPAPMPSEFEIGLHTYFDFGPPFNYYEVFLVHPLENGSSVERLTVTPQGISCAIPPKVEVASAKLEQPPSALLGTVNPCSIPEKELHRERKRCKKCMNFSGAFVTMQVDCGSQTRLIRSDILDRDWFDPAAHTPEHTSWTMELLGTLAKPLGPSVMDKPVFPVTENDASSQPPNSSTFARLMRGDFDALFVNAPDKLSALALVAQGKLPPTTKLVSSSPFSPLDLVLPSYPPLAKLTKTEGSVTLTLQIDENGNVSSVAVEEGNRLLQGAVQDTVSKWKFPKEAANQKIQATIEFNLNCTK